MNDYRITINELWNRLFGAIWPAVTGAGIKAGAFMLDKEANAALCDEGALMLLGIDGTDGSPAEVDHEILGGVLDRLAELQSDDLPLSISMIGELPEGFLAGIVTLNDRGFANSQVDAGLLSQSELFARLGAAQSSPLLLTKILGTEGSPAEQSYCMSSAVRSMMELLPEGACMAERTEGEFWILLPEGSNDPLGEAGRLRAAVEGCKLMDGFGSVISERHYMSLMTGVCNSELLPSYKMHAATFALYQAMANGEPGEELFRREHYAKEKSEYGEMVKFSKLLDQTLFKYHFQPIVSARTGEIVAYEALMRTDPSIGFNPLEILELARRYGRLYDIELATIRNTLEHLSENQSYFENRHLFINSISSHLLTEEDFNSIKSVYGELMEKVVVELTEQTELDDDDLNYCLNRIRGANMQLAIDDYGTGYSNTSNLLRYKPQVVKIDRSLISGIDSNPKMQKLVSSVIDFLHASGMLALGEGVETVDEVRTLINMSVDLFQGFYISRPKPVLVNSIAEDIRQEIININLEAAGLIKKLYHAHDGEKIDLRELALEKYTDIFIGSGKVEFTGGEQLLKLPMTVGDSAECEIILHNVCIEAEDDDPAIKLGENSRVHLIVEGRNRLEHSGIFVPAGSSIQISGAGDLTISPEAHESYAIGNKPGLGYGDILIDMSGRLELNVNGENCVGIGGGKAGIINITAGQTNINCTSGSCVAIGSCAGGARVSLGNCAVNIMAAAATAVCIGSMQGNAVIDIRDAAVDCIGSGNRLCGIGTLDGSRTKLTFSDIRTSVEMRGKNIICIGSYGGVTDCDIQHVSVTLYAEGGRVSGIGDMAGSGAVKISESELTLTFLTGEGFDIGSPDGTVELRDVIKHIRINE